jgi:hypothetical protein
MVLIEDGQKVGSGVENIGGGGERNIRKSGKNRNMKRDIRRNVVDKMVLAVKACLSRSGVINPFTLSLGTSYN